MTKDEQIWDALARANTVRVARAALKARVASGELLAADVVLSPPPEAMRLTVFDLLMAQYRWGRLRTRRLLAVVEISELKTLGALTTRQRLVLIEQLLPVPEEIAA